MRGDSCEPAVAHFGIDLGLFIGSGEERLSAVCATTVHINAVTLFEDIRSVKHFWNTAPLIFDLMISLSAGGSGDMK
jgi:hypothetical protein